VELTRVTALVLARTGVKYDSEVSEVEEEGSVEKTRGTQPLETMRIGCSVGPDCQPSENVMDDRLEDPSRQSRALWVIVEELVHLPKVFFPLQLDRFHYIPRDPNGFEVDRPIIEVD
jgi:hypothetical protein